DCHILWYHKIPALGVPGASNWNEARAPATLMESSPFMSSSSQTVAERRSGNGWQSRRSETGYGWVILERIKTHLGSTWPIRGGFFSGGKRHSRRLSRGPHKQRQRRRPDTAKPGGCVKTLPGSLIFSTVSLRISPNVGWLRSS